MSVDFSSLKKNKGFDSLVKEIEKLASPAASSGKDDRYWQPEVDKAGNGYAVIRFLPAPAGEEVPWVRLWTHGFKGPTGKWYIENSLTTLNQPDPVSEYNTQLWNSNSDENKKIATAQKRKLYYISNIYVVKDPTRPENEGKVFLFKYGKQIFDIIKDTMDPQFEDDNAVNPFDFWKGANFKLKIRQLDGYRNYAKSEFDSPSSLSDDDSKLESIWKQQYSLQEVIDPKNFKSYDELKKRFEMVLSAAPASKAESVTLENFESKSKPMPTARTAQEVDLDDEDESLDYFSKLANS